MVQAQLLLLPTDSTWQLDPSTRRIGREGLALARAALAKADTSTHATIAEPAVAQVSMLPFPTEHSLAA